LDICCFLFDSTEQDASKIDPDGLEPMQFASRVDKLYKQKNAGTAHHPFPMHQAALSIAVYVKT
jgi:hypothetical protein